MLHLDGGALQEEVVGQLHRSASYIGSGVRLGTGELVDPHTWPRASVNASWWRWRTVVAYPLGGQHINALELRACLAALRWRLTTSERSRRRITHFTDSQVSLSVMVKGRSSSRVLRFVLRRYNSLISAACLYAAYAYISTSTNPADRPSRWW